MVAMTCEMDKTDLSRLDGLLQRVQREAPRRLATETRRAAIYLCQALRSRTRTAPKKARPNEYRAAPSDIPPRYVHSNSAHHRLLRRWSLTRKLGTPDQYTRHHFVYTNARRAKNRRMVGKSQASERRELLKLHGGIRRAGLAKKSWGWIMKKIYNGASAADIAYRRIKGERRDPRLSVNGVFSKSRTGAFALIRNALDYIRDAIRPGAVEKAVNAAARRLEYNIANQLERQIA